MTVPVVGSLSRKPPWRYLPEIHATRFSVSASLRPKLGLLILLVLLALSLILLLVPLVTLGTPERKEPVTSVLPVSAFSTLLLNLLKTGSNPVFSPFSLLKLTHLVHSLQDTQPGESSPYPELKIGTLQDLNKIIPSFKSNIHINTSCINEISSGFSEVASFAGATLEVTSDTCDKFSILNTNKLQVSLANSKMSEEAFLVNSKLTKVIPMAVIYAEMNVAKFDQWEIVEVNLNPEMSLQILLPAQINGLGAVLNETQGVISSAGKGINKNVELKLPIFLSENAFSSAELHEAGFRNINSGVGSDHALREGEPVSSKPVPHLVHITWVQLTTDGGVFKDPNLSGLEKISCDREFMFNLLSSNLSVPLVSGIFRPVT